MASDVDVPMQVDVVRKKVIKEEIRLQELIQNIRECGSSFEDLSRLSSNARKLLLSIQNGIKEIKLLCEEENLTDCLEHIVQKHQNNYATLQTSLRKANLMAEERVFALQKQVLMYGKEDQNGMSRRIKNKEETAKTATKITDGLLRSARLMETQVKESEESTRKLQESSQDIKKTHDEYRGLTAVIGSSRKLINKYTRRELTDTILIFFGLILFFSTVLYIILKRI